MQNILSHLLFFAYKEMKDMVTKQEHAYKILYRTLKKKKGKLIFGQTSYKKSVVMHGINHYIAQDEFLKSFQRNNPDEHAIIDKIIYLM